MRNYVLLLLCLYLNLATSQENSIRTVRDSFLSVATDARAAGQGDVGVATSPDAFSQYWNPAKIIFSDKPFEVGFTQIKGSVNDFDNFTQLNFNFYNQLNERSAYGLSFRGYATRTDPFIQATLELSIDGAYALKLSDNFAMSVGGRYISLKDKAPFLLDINGEFATSLYGVDVSGYYYGNEMAFNKINGRWRAGIHLSNLRNSPSNENTFIEIYAPSTLSAGLGFDFIFDAEQLLGVTTEYKTLVDSYTEDENGEPLVFGLEGSVAALGLAYTFREKIALRTGYSYGINRVTDTFFSAGAGFSTKQVDIDVAGLFGVSEQENPTRQNLRLSLTLDVVAILANQPIDE